MSNQIPTGQKLRVIRTVKNLQQMDVANISGLNSAYISLIERGKMNPTTEQLTAIEAALGVKFDDPAVEAAFATLAGSSLPPHSAAG